MLYWGFDLGDGESALARVSGEGLNLPEVVEVEGKKVVLTAWAVMKNGEVRIGESAARSASSAVRSAARFKSRFLDPQADSPGLIRDFSARIFESLRGSGELVGGETNNCVYIGCPAGWDAAARDRYRRIFETLGCPSPQVVSESRAVMVGAVQSNSVRDYVDLRSKSVLVVDIGSSTTDFAYIRKCKEAEIRTGGEVFLGGGIMDEVLLESCVDASPNAKALRKVFAESESWRVDSELRARQLKERYFSRPRDERQEDDCADSLLIRYDEPLILDLFLNEAMAKRLTEKPCAQLGGRSFRDVFCEGLREVRRSIGEEPPELLFLTGGVSRMEEIGSWCRTVFPEAVIYLDREPEFSVARGLAWCGRIDDELQRFRAEVAAYVGSDAVENSVSAHLGALYEGAMDHLLDPLLDHAVAPVLLEWRDGELERLSDIGPVLQERIKTYLHSEEAKACLYRPVSDWVRRVSEDLEADTSPICRRYHVPDRSLNISSRLDASDLRLLEQIDAKDVFTGEAFAGAAFFVESIISVLIGFLCGGSGLALIAEGPIGIAIGVVSSMLLFAVGRIMGKSTVDQAILNMKLPLAVRRMALNSVLPKLEGPSLGLQNPLKKWHLSGDDGEKDDGAARNTGKAHLLPRLSWAKENGISERRMRAIRKKVRAGYERLLADEDNAELKALNRRMCTELSGQIEQRLRELAEQVEIPL